MRLWRSEGMVDSIPTIEDFGSIAKLSKESEGTVSAVENIHHNTYELFKVGLGVLESMSPAIQGSFRIM